MRGAARGEGWEEISIDWKCLYSRLLFDWNNGVLVLLVFNFYAKCYHYFNFDQWEERF